MYGLVEGEILRLSFILAYRQALNVLAFYPPCADFRRQRGACLAANEAIVVAALVNAMTLRASSGVHRNPPSVGFLVALDLW